MTQTIETDGATILLRTREVLEKTITGLAAGDLCTYCDRPIVQGLFHWNDERGQPLREDPMYHGGKPGPVQSFPSWRHADGTEGHGVHRFGPNDHGVILTKDRCPDCGAFDSLTRRDTGYRDLLDCAECSYHSYYDRGD
jgi:hypothetical protein